MAPGKTARSRKEDGKHDDKFGKRETAIGAAPVSHPGRLSIYLSIYLLFCHQAGSGWVAAPTAKTNNSHMHVSFHPSNLPPQTQTAKTSPAATTQPRQQGRVEYEV